MPGKIGRPANCMTAANLTVMNRSGPVISGLSTNASKVFDLTIRFGGAKTGYRNLVQRVRLVAYTMRITFLSMASMYPRRATFLTSSSLTI